MVLSMNFKVLTMNIVAQKLPIIGTVKLCNKGLGLFPPSSGLGKLLVWLDHNIQNWLGLHVKHKCMTSGVATGHYYSIPVLSL